MFQRFFLDLKVFYRATQWLSKLLILLHLVFSTIRLISHLNFYIIHFLLTGLNSELLVFLMERTTFNCKR